MEGGSRTLESLVTNQEKYEKEGHRDRSRLTQFYNSEFQVIALSPHVMIFTSHLQNLPTYFSLKSGR